jgi:hypothetical protein
MFPFSPSAARAGRIVYHRGTKQTAPLSVPRQSDTHSQGNRTQALT